MVKTKVLIPAILALGLFAAGCSFPDINFGGGKSQNQSAQGAGNPSQAKD